MTVHTEKNATQTGGSPTPRLTRLRMRETGLRRQALQLMARAEHLERVNRAQDRQLQRQVDAHEKIVLGALVKKAGLDLLPCQPADDVTPIRKGVASQSAVYDRALILGALMWMASALNQSSNFPSFAPDRQRLREDGRRALQLTTGNHSRSLTEQ